MANHLAKNIALIHQIGQASAAGLLPKFRASAVAFLRKDLVDSCPQRREQLVEEIRKNHEAYHIEIAGFINGKQRDHHSPRFTGPSAHPSRKSSLRSANPSCR